MSCYEYYGQVRSLLYIVQKKIAHQTSTDLIIVLKVIIYVLYLVQMFIN